MTIPELLRHWAHATPDAPALLAPGGAYWWTLAEDVRWYDGSRGPHVTLFQQPHADALGEVLGRVLREAA